MESSAIIFPAAAMFMLTFSVIAYLGASRLAAIRRGTVSIRYYRRYSEGEQTPRLQVIGRHTQNHFEVPPLFYIVVLFLYVTNGVTPLAVAFAWLYFASRCVHSFIHLGSNNVTQRAIVFALSGLIMVGLWILLLLSIASRDAVVVAT
ncbi:MAG: MAPEG family protein [Myxococcota bacterium]